MPIAFSMAFVGFMGFSLVTSFKTGLSVLPREIFEQLTSYSISAIPMFILMGFYAFSAGLGTRLYEAAYKILGPIRGGLAIASIFACAAFGAICGSSTATAATMGKLAIPTMKKYGYDDSLSTGCIACAGTLGVLIPPSVIFLIYGFMTEQSIGKLFISGIIPGIILAIFMSLAVYLVCLKNPSYGPKGPKSSYKDMIWSLIRVVDVLALFLVVIGGLLYGFFTPTQAGGAGAAGALIIGLLRRELSWKIFIDNTLEALRTSVYDPYHHSLCYSLWEIHDRGEDPSCPFQLGWWFRNTSLSDHVYYHFYLRCRWVFYRCYTFNHPYHPYTLSHCNFSWI